MRHGVHQPDFRAYALAALAAMDQPASHMKLRKLMDEPDDRGPLRCVQRPADARSARPVPRVGPRARGAETDDEDDEPSDSMAVAIAIGVAGEPAPQETRSLSTSSTRKAPRWSTCRGADDPRSSSSAASRNCCRRSCWAPAPILLNAAENDDKIELSKIVPSRFGDADIKITPRSTWPRWSGKTANLGATYPEIVSILETAKRQKNLLGELVVDAVPSSNRVYLEAVLGKDTTAKNDDSVKRTSAANSKPKPALAVRILRPGFGSTGPEQIRIRQCEQGCIQQSRMRSRRDPRSATGMQSDSDPTASETLKKAADRRTDPTAKKDDAVQKATADEPRPAGVGSSISSEEAIESSSARLVRSSDHDI